VLFNEPEKQKYIINELKVFSDSGDVYLLAENLNKILKKDHQRVLLEEIKPFIPGRQRSLFDNLTRSSPETPIQSPPSSYTHTHTHLHPPPLSPPTKFDNRSIIYTSLVDKNKMKKPAPGRR
jgi:hypothetical protein